MDVLGLICARGGSKGIPRKNLKELGGHSLLEIAIKKAIASKIFSEIIVSTDDPEIATLAKTTGAKVPFIRPKTLASDKSPKYLVFRHALKKAEKLFGKKYDVLVDIDVSVPFTTPEDIEAVIKLMEKEKPDAIVSSYVARHNPYFNMMEVGKGGFIHISKKPKSELRIRQESPQVLQLTAGIIAAKRTVLLKGNTLYTDRVKAYIMPEERSVMVDNEIDFKLAKILFDEGVVKIEWC